MPSSGTRSTRVVTHCSAIASIGVVGRVGASSFAMAPTLCRAADLLLVEIRLEDLHQVVEGGLVVGREGDDLAVPDAERQHAEDAGGVDALARGGREGHRDAGLGG